MLLENVRQGKFSRQYNRGTAECFLTIPNNRYLKLESASTYDRRHICTSLSYRFAVKPEYKAEFEHLRRILNEWADENQVSLSWVVREDGWLGGYPFPGNQYHSFQPDRLGIPFRLGVRAVSVFAVDPELPLDHMSPEDPEEQDRKARARIAHRKERCDAQKKKYIQYAALTALFAVLAIACLIAKLFALAILESIISLAVWSVVRGYRRDYREAKKLLEYETQEE